MKNDWIALNIPHMAQYVAGVSVAAILAGGLFAPTVAAEVMPALAKKHECQLCHDIDKRLIGPSLREVAMRYKGAVKFNFDGKEYPLEAGLVLKVSRGGAGNWGSMPMPGNDLSGTQQSEIKDLVRFVLSLAK